MNPIIVFWVPAVLAIALVILISLVVGYFVHPVLGVVLMPIGLGSLIVLQLSYLYRLAKWLDDPHSKQLPEGWGAWTEIFSRLVRLRREDKKNQRELSEWLARFRQAMTLLPDGVVIMDDVLCLEWCNPIAEIHLGLKLERDKSRRITNILRNPEFIDHIILGRFDKPITITHRDRKIILHLIQFEDRRQILVTHDITERERIDSMRRDFVANASHELRTPLTVINGFLEISAAQPELDSKVRQEHTRLMLEQGQRMQCLVDDMLMLTRMESIDTPFELEHVDMTELIDRLVAELNALSLGKHEINLIREDVDLLGNSEELHSAFGNLISNAVKYTPTGGQITVSWTNTVDGPRFMVKDTGIGISSEHLSRLTERFYRVDKGRSRQAKGTGLGLAIVKHIVLRHNAELVIHSTLGAGSEFSVQFPADAKFITSSSAQ